MRLEIETLSAQPLPLVSYPLPPQNHLFGGQKGTLRTKKRDGRVSWLAHHRDLIKLRMFSVSYTQIKINFQFVFVIMHEAHKTASQSTQVYMNLCGSN